MSDPPDDPDRPRSDSDPDPDRREPHPDRRGTDAERRSTDRREEDAERRAADRREADAIRDRAGRREADAIRDRAGRRGTGLSGPTDAVADRDRDRDERAVGHANDADARDRGGTDPGALRWLSGVVSLVGLWLAASALVYETTRAALWNNAVVGVAIFLLAGYGFYRLARDRRPDVGSTGLAALLGLWAVAAPFLLEYPSDALVWSTVASGIAVAVLSGYNAYESRRSAAAGATDSRA